MMHRVSSCGVGSWMVLVASACQLVPNPALIGGDTSTGVDPATSSSTSAMDGVDTTGPVGSTSSGPQDSTSSAGPQGSTSSGPAEQLWCMDADGDGFGDPTTCMQAVDMPPGTVDDDEDCDDGDPDTFPGAARLDDPAACMHDADDDGWGDDTPPAGVDAGTDCDDTDDNAFPGAAENEDPPDQCTVDADGDGWGDANPSGGGGGGGGGPVAGSDCYDGNPDLNPDALQLSTFVPFGAPGAPRMLMTVDTATAVLAPFVTLEDPMGSIPDISVSSATMDANGMIFANDFGLNELHTVSYADTCGGGTGVVTGLGSYAPPTSVSGLELAGNGTLYGISNDDHLYAFDPITGQVIDDIPLALDVDAAGMAYDCAQDRLLFANGIDQSIYSIDPVTGAVTLLRDLSADLGPAAWNTVGLAWDPVSRTVYLSTGGELYDVDIDDMAALPELINGFGGTIVSNLAYLPICSP